MEKYIITFEDGLHYVATEITDAELLALSDGLLTIVRCSDCTEMIEDGEFVPLKKWGNKKIYTKLVYMKNIYKLCIRN